MTKKGEVENCLNRIWRIVHIAKESLEFCFYLYRPETDEEATYINNSQHWEFIRHILWRNTAIELSKVLSKSKSRDKNNIFNFLKKFDHGQYFGNLNVHPNQLAEWNTRLANFEETRTKILLLRDKVYSHSDNVDLSKEIPPSLNDVRKIIELIEEIVQKLFNDLLDIHADMDNVIFTRDRFFMIKNLVQYEQFRSDQVLQEIMRSKKN